MTAAQAQSGRQPMLAQLADDTRRASLGLLDGLTPEDCMMQSMAEASPVKWHVGHMAWFFETFLLEPNERDFAPIDPRFREIFNSYYVGIGARQPRAERGLLSRPALAEVLAYQEAVHGRVLDLLKHSSLSDAVLDVIELGINHEQQHQELVVTDLKHHFWHNPLRPAWKLQRRHPGMSQVAPMSFVAFEGGLREIGHAGLSFAFDNERPRHRVWLEPFELAARPVTNAEYRRFMEDGGYRRPDLWLSDGWDACRTNGWEAPLYWSRDAQGWRQYTLAGEQPVNDAEPVCHIGYYEADAFARWAGARLPTEAEWETAAASADPATGDFADSAHFHPQPPAAGRLAGMWGGVWEWTQSAYLPYPGFRIAEGAVGEYNGKFMINQMVLRGGSCATPRGHVRGSYRNFFAPGARWQFSGLRLARS